MSKKFLPLFALVFITVLLTVTFYPQKILSANDHIVISQIQISGATATDEFVELFNPTSNQIDLSGYRLTKKVSSGTQSNLVASMSGVINPNSYFLLGHQNYLGSVTADKVYSTSTVTADNTVILYSDAGTTVVDKVGFGVPFTGEYETLPFPSNPAPNQSIIRKNSIDSNDNSIDFEILQEPNPRNTNRIESTPSPTPQVDPTANPTASPAPTNLPTVIPSTPSPTPDSTTSPTPTDAPTTIPTKTAEPTKTSNPSQNGHKSKRGINLPFRFKCEFERKEFKFKKINIRYYKIHFNRD